eukprot:COSAG03_NODE_541_length_7067_cov_2.200201_8_plen_86_part_00
MRGALLACSYWDQTSKPGARYSFYRKSTRGHNTLTFDGNCYYAVYILCLVVVSLVCLLTGPQMAALLIIEMNAEWTVNLVGQGVT